MSAWAKVGLLAAVFVVAGCSRGASRLPAPGEAVVPRSIPLVFFVLRGQEEPNAVTEEDLWQAVGLANRVFEDARLSFYIHGIARISTRYLHRNDDGDELLPWSVVAPDALAMAPWMAEIGLDDSHRTHRALWLGQVASRMPPDGISVFITPFNGHNGKMWGSNCAAPFPHNDRLPYYDPGPGRGWIRDGSKGIFCTPSGRLHGHRIDALAHELGHYIGGLHHTWDVTNERANRISGVVPEDAFDLLYAPEQGGTIQRFRSREEVSQAQTPVLPLDSNCAGCSGKASRRVLPGTACVTEFRLPLPGGEWLSLNSAENPELLYGMAFPPRPGDWRYGINVMSYLHQNSEVTPCEFRLSGSQILLLHRHLHSSQGQRDLLGTIRRSRLSLPAALVR